MNERSLYVGPYLQAKPKSKIEKDVNEITDGFLYDVRGGLSEPQTVQYFGLNCRIEGLRRPLSIDCDFDKVLSSISPAEEIRIFRNGIDKYLPAIRSNYIDLVIDWGIIPGDF